MLTGGPDFVGRHTTVHYDDSQGTRAMLDKNFWNTIIGSTGSAIFTLPRQDSWTMSGNLTISGGTLAVTNAQTLTVSGSFIESGGGFSPGAGTGILRGIGRN